MALSLQQRHAIERLLLQREALYAHIHHLETRIHEVLGSAYPLPPPPDSVARHRPPKKTPAKRSRPSKPWNLRPLSEHEVAWELRYRSGGAVHKERHVDGKRLQAVLRHENLRAQLESLVTIAADGTVCQTLLKKS